jgi:hypothetical protein
MADDAQRLGTARPGVRAPAAEVAVGSLGGIEAAASKPS